MILKSIQSCMLSSKKNKYLHCVNLWFKGLRLRNDWFWFN